MTLSAADLTSSGRKRSDIDFESFSDPKRRKTEKGGKGLRHFSMKVSHAYYCLFLLSRKSDTEIVGDVGEIKRQTSQDWGQIEET